jgi:hypothetical protein
MKIDLRFNVWMVVWIFIICFTFLIALVYAVKNAGEYYEYNKYISDNMKGNIDFYYSCDSNFYSAFYNCPINQSLKNLTGYYCNGTKICENSYKRK